MALAWTKTELRLFPVLAGEASVTSVEAWIYVDPELEAELGTEAWTDLVSINFKAPDAEQQFLTLVEALIDRGRFETWNLLRLLRSVQRAPIEAGTWEGLYELWCGCPGHAGRYAFLEPLGICACAEEPLTLLSEQLAAEARRLELALEEQRIVITKRHEYEVRP